MTLYLDIERLRNARKWSQPELARRSGVDQATIWKYENGQVARLNLKSLEALAAALGVHPSTLIQVRPPERKKAKRAKKSRP